MADVRTVIAGTGEDGRYAAVVGAAIARARDARATLILYDLDAAESPLESPVPTAWSAEGAVEEVSDRLGPVELQAAGRGAIAEQVRDARAQGLDAWGWLPSDGGRKALIEYAANQPGARVLVPAGDPDLSVEDLPEAEVVPTDPASD